MAVFAIISTDSKEELRAAVEENFANAFFELSPSQFLISANKMTAAQVNSRIGASGGTVGRVLVLLVTDYSGWHSKDMWAWLIAQIGPEHAVPPEDPARD